MLKEVKAVLFDLDGTLVDSMWMWKNIDIEFLDARNIPYPEDLENAIEGMSFSETADYFAERFSLPESPEELKVIWNGLARDKYEKEVPLKPGVEEFLSYLKDNGIKMGIATSNSRELLETVLNSHGIIDDFDYMLTADEVKKGKPAPDVFLATAEKLGVLPEQCLVFEDVPNGILAGKAAGMRVCTVEDNYSKELLDTKKKLADYYITSYKEVLDNTYEVLENE